MELENKPDGFVAKLCQFEIVIKEDIFALKLKGPAVRSIKGAENVKQG